MSGTTSGLQGVSFVDTKTGTAVGYQGTILRTVDGGDTWTGQFSGTNTLLNAVHFVNVDTGTAVGFGGIILRTTTGGE